MLKITKTYGEEKPTYFVVAEGGNAPTKRHFSRIAASKEAQRLTRENPGRVFHVAKLKESYTAEAAISGQREGMVGGSSEAMPIGEIIKRRGINIIAGVLAEAIREGSRVQNGEDEDEEQIAEFDVDSPDLTPEERADNERTLAKARERMAAMTIGGDVIVIAAVSVLPGLLPHNLVRATYLGMSSDPDYAMVRFNVKDDDGSVSTKDDRVNISRLFEENDAEMRDMLGLSADA